MAAEYAGVLTDALAVGAETVDNLGSGLVRGFISVTGVPDSLRESNSEETAVQEALCELSPCPIVVVDESGSTRMLLAGARPRRRRRRRLANLVDVQFEICLVTENEDEEEQTSSQQAASLFNKMADPGSLSAVASVLDVGVEDVTFHDLVFYQRAQVPIVAEFDLESIAGGDSGSSAAVGIVVVVAMVIGVLVPLVGCIMCCVKQHHREMQRREDAYLSRTASHKAQVSAFYSAEERRRAGSAGYESRSARIDSSGQFDDPAIRAPSLGQTFKPATQTPSITSAGELHGDEPDKFSHINPMLNTKRAIAPNVSFGAALKRHYQDDDANAESDSSAEPLPTMTGDIPPVMDKSLALSSQTAALARGRGSAASLPLQLSGAAVAAAAAAAAARATASFSTAGNSDPSGQTPRGTESRSKVMLTPHDSSPDAKTEFSAGREVAAVATAKVSSMSATGGDAESYVHGGVGRDARGVGGGLGGRAGGRGRGGGFSGSYDSGDFDEDSLTSSSSAFTMRPLQPALAMQSNGSTASALTPRSERSGSPTSEFTGFGCSPTSVSDCSTDDGLRMDTLSEGVQEQGKTARNSGDNNVQYQGVSGADAMRRHDSSGSRLLEDPRRQLGLTSDAPVEARAATGKAAGYGKIGGGHRAQASERPYPRLQQHGLGSVSPTDEILEGEAGVDADIGPASSRTAEAAGREETGSSAPKKRSVEPLRPPEVDQRTEPPKSHLPESKTAETELTVVTVVPVVTRYLPGNNASQDGVTPREDVDTALSLKVPASAAKVSTYGGDRPIPALIKSEYFRASAERGSLSLSRSFSSSELDYDRAQQKEAHAGDGRRVLGATLTLRQHLADPSEPSRSYRRQESYESSISSCASLSLSFKGDPSQWGNPIGEAKASASTPETAALAAVAAAMPREEAPKPVVLEKEEPTEAGLSAAAAMAGLGCPAQCRNREAMAANAGATAPRQGAGKTFLVQFPVLPQDAPSSAPSSARRVSLRSSRSSGTLGSLSLSESFSSEDLDYDFDFTRRDEEDSESDGRGPVGVRITPLQQDTSREKAAKEGTPAMAAAPAPAPAVNAEGPEADATECEATILSMYHSLFAKRTTSSSAAPIDLSWC